MNNNLITRKNLEDNEYIHVQTTSNLKLYAKENHRLIVENHKDHKDLYMIRRCFSAHNMNNMSYEDLNEKIQLDLFYNKPHFDNTKNLEKYLTSPHRTISKDLRDLSN